MPSKALFVFCDGTGMDGSLTSESTDLKDSNQNSIPNNHQDDSQSPNILENIPEGVAHGAQVDKKSGSVQYPTNVLRLSRSVMSMDKQGRRQIVFYQSGVGSEADFAGESVTGADVLKALGTAVASKIRDAYVFVAQNYEEGDEIYIFGFSRGAYTARKLSGLIDRIGLLKRTDLGHFFEIWRQLMDNETPTIPPADTRRATISCVGVWDTVGSVYNQIDALSIQDTSLPATVKVALHAVSLQENREKFLPTLWTEPMGGLNKGQILKQIWFPGAHSDVGGGYERHELADISLFWMAGEIMEALPDIGLDKDFLKSWRQPNPDPWGTSQPHNAYEETNVITRQILGHETRLESRQITPQSSFHASVQDSPEQLEDPKYMITLKLIQGSDSFGPDWKPEYCSLNQFEQECKGDWESGTLITMPHPRFEHPTVLFD